MMKQKKMLNLLLALVLSLSLLTGCGNSAQQPDDSSDNNNTTDTEQPKDENQAAAEQLLST